MLVLQLCDGVLVEVVAMLMGYQDDVSLRHLGVIYCHIAETLCAVNSDVEVLIAHYDGCMLDKRNHYIFP